MAHPNMELSQTVSSSPEATMNNENDMSVRKEIILTVPLRPTLIMNLHTPLPVALYNHQRLSSSGLVCRICHEDESQEELVSPCQCSGTLGLAHASCIEKWLSSSNTMTCEICKYEYSLSRQPKSLCQWLQSGTANNGPSGLYGDMFCLVLLTPLCLVSVYLCAIGAQVYIRHGLWEGSGLAMLCCFLMAVYVLWCFVTIRFHCKRLKRWQTVNQTVRLVDKFYSEKTAAKTNPKTEECVVEVSARADCS